MILNKANEKLIKDIDKFAKSDATILIQGEPGTGKYALAKHIHKMSRRKEHPFVQIKCVAISDEQLDSELFGHREKSYTETSEKSNYCLLRYANKGTVFLEAIDELSMRLQAKLCHALEQKQFIPSGGGEPVELDVRVIAATNFDLYHKVEAGQFRETFYYYLNVLDIKIPPLRHRRNEITPLAHHYLNKFNCQYNNNATISDEFLNMINEYDWPGNMNQLKNMIEKHVIKSDGREIQCEDLPKTIQPISSKKIELGDFNKLIDSYEKEIIKEANKRYKSSRQVAAALNLSQTKASKLIRKHCIVTE